MRLWLLLALGLIACGCTSHGLPPDYVKAHELLRKGTIPNISAIYRKAHKLEDETDATRRGREASALKLELSEQIKSLDALAPRLKVPNKADYVPATLAEIGRWKAEAESYLAYLDWLGKARATDDKSIREAMSVATRERNYATGHAQSVFDKTIGVSSGMSRPQMVDLAR